MLKSNLNSRILSLKKEKDARADGSKKQEGVDLRLQKDMSELDLNGSTVTIKLENKENLRELDVVLRPAEGFYKGGTFDFHITVPPQYPHDPPKAICKTPVYHPNIDQEGKVCLNILRADWKPVLTMKAVLYGLELLFIEPNPDDPLNKEAAKVLREDRSQFQRQVSRVMRQGYL
eukprot:NODE_2475_length_1056_cov_861.047363_g2457_i0.p1 GENE.NODE_2475_length_1056_cov_861.047363_g2457_i0~~NODE_2475_length_1056_cov_861.047363_g2457_i0.p1  ORF type:complete len:175 (-),score=25.85 NODE_2475_length_1056_cov_861.047363_g2457_i0:46-570(-)